MVEAPTAPTQPAEAAITEKNKPAEAPSRFRRWRWVLFVLCAALAALADELMKTDNRALIAGVLLGVGLPLAWALVWSIAGRLISGEFRFGEHATIGAIVLLIMIGVQPIEPFVRALGTKRTAIGVEAVVLGAGAAFVVARGLFHVLRGRGRRATWAAGAAIGVVIGFLSHDDRRGGTDLPLYPGFFPGIALVVSPEPLDVVLAGELFQGDAPEIATSTKSTARRSTKRDATRIAAGLELDRAEATVREYRACVAAGACSPASKSADCQTNEQLPINCVRLEQARAYCAWAGGRLPADAEWPAAARGKIGAWVEYVDPQLPGAVFSRTGKVATRWQWAPWTADPSIGVRCIYDL